MSVEATLARIDTFLIGRVSAAGYDFVRLNTIALAFGRIKRDLTFLEITAAEYRVAASELLADSEATWQRAEKDFAELRRTGMNSVSRRLTDEEVALVEAHSRLAHRVFLRIDTLYFVGSRLLDSVVAAADTLLSPAAGKPRGRKDLGRHRTVRARLDERIAAGLAPPAVGLLPLVDVVTERIKDYRDDYVAHQPPPTFPERRPTVSVGPERHSLIREGVPRTEESDDLVGLLVRYVDTWLDYLERVSLPFEWPAQENGSRVRGLPE